MSRKSDYGKDIYKQLQEVMGRLDSVENDFKNKKNEHKQEVDQLNDKIKNLENVIEEKDRKIEILMDDNERLKRIINNDSSNSSLPPSTDKKTKSANTYNSRKKSEKKVGAQIGHKGITLTKKEVEEKLASGKFQHNISHIGNISEKYVIKYVLDLKVIPTVTEVRIYADQNGKFNIPDEYRSDVTYGSMTKALAIELYSEGVVSNDRIGAFINAVSGGNLNLSEGSVYNFCRGFSKRCKESVKQIEVELLNALTVNTDATVVTEDGIQSYVRNFSTEGAVLYEAMEKKDLAALKDIEFLVRFAGTLEHDHETALYHFGTAHGECNVHLMRYLAKNVEEAKTCWASDMAGLLCEMNDERKKRISEGNVFTSEEIIVYEGRYDDIINDGRTQNKKTTWRIAKKEEKALLNRLEKYKANHLLFIHDFSVPFENNISERDLRKCKNRQKMAGGFRKHSGNEMYCTIMSVIETCKKKKMQVFDSINKTINGTQAIF